MAADGRRIDYFVIARTCCVVGFMGDRAIIEWYDLREEIARSIYLKGA
jgi:hypothetical protein